MNVSTVSRIVLCAAAILGAAAAYSPWFGGAAVAASLAGVPLVLLAVPRGRSRPGDDVASGSDAPSDPTPELAFACLLLGAGACWRLFTHVSFESVLPWLLAGVVGAALLTAGALRLGLATQRSAAPAFAAFALTSAAALGWLDVAFDRAPPLRAQVAVTWLDADSANPFAPHVIGFGVGATGVDWRRVVVSTDDRRHLFLASTACLEEHDGAFGQRWAAAHPCAGDDALPGEVAARRWIEHNARPLADFPASTRRVLAGQWRDVDRELTDLEQRFAAGEASDDEVDQAFEAFHIASPRLDAPLQAWLEKAPGSYAAHMAAAEHARAQFDVLGRGGFDAWVSPDLNFLGQREEAMRQLRAAEALLPKPSSLAVLMRYRMTTTNAAHMDEWLDSALAANPDDLLMRREYLLQHPLCPCGGGEPVDEAMKHVLARPAPPQVQAALVAVRLYERGVDLGINEQSASLYRQAIAAPAYRQELYTANINLAVFLDRQGKHDEALALLDAAIAVAPYNVHAHEVRAVVHEEMGQFPQAIADYLVDARRQQLDAQHAAGRMLLWGKLGVPADLPEAARWIAEAANLGEDEARGLLRSRADLLALVGKRPVRALSEGAPPPGPVDVAPRADTAASEPPARVPHLLVPSR